MDLMKTVASLRSKLLIIIVLFGILLFSAVILAGVTVVSSFLYPILSIIAEAAIAVFVIAILPLSLFNRLRPILSKFSFALSFVCGITVWIYSFLVINSSISWATFLIIFFFHAAAPIAVIVLLIKKQWVAALSIGVGLIFTYGIRFYSVWLASLCDRAPAEYYPIIDPADKKLSRYCPRCRKTYDKSWVVCLRCSENLLENIEFSAGG